MIKMVESILNGEYKIIIPEHRANRPEWYTIDGWEKIRLKSIHDNISNKDIMYYIGAEEGEMPALCQMWGAETILFEPNPKVWSNIYAIYKANNLQEPLFYQGFASNIDKIPKNFQQLTWEEIGEKVIEEAHGFKELYQEAENYPQYRIDTIVEQTNKIPTALSIDVEGSEFEVLKGAENTLKEYHPKIWLSLHPEFLFHQWGVYSAEVRNWLKSLEYKETLLEYKHEVHLFYESI